MDKLLTLKEVCEILKMSRISIYRLLKKKEIPAFKVGKNWKFECVALESWIEKKKAPLK